MAEEPDLSFPPFRLDLANERLWRGAEPLTLRPKAFLLLRYLAEHPERLLTQEELLKALWQHGYVSDGLLRGYIRTLREVLGDDAKNPRFIETAGGRGYRFIAPLTSTRPVPSFIESALQPPSHSSAGTRSWRSGASARWCLSQGSVIRSRRPRRAWTADTLRRPDKHDLLTHRYKQLA